MGARLPTVDGVEYVVSWTSTLVGDVADDLCHLRGGLRKSLPELGFCEIHEEDGVHPTAHERLPTDASTATEQGER
ncbi:MAG: hypothetical protein U0531_11885 [Dehalococcoidia bacterium]